MHSTGVQQSVDVAARDYLRRDWKVIPVRLGEKRCRLEGWPDLIITPDLVPRYFGHGENIGIIDGSRSGDLVDIDLDCPEALELADIYLPRTECEFGRPSKPRAHRLFRAEGARYAPFADPCADNAMMVEMRADGPERGAHYTMAPPSLHPSGETVAWDAPGEPRTIAGDLLRTVIAWLAIGCLVARYISPSTARAPADDFPKLLWEFDETLGRAAFKWLGRRAPDEVRQQIQPRREWTGREFDLAEIVRAIPNNFDFWGWNKIGMAIWNASGGSDAGRDLFDMFSATHPKYQPAAVDERWANYTKGKPSKIGMGSLVHHARQAGWRRGGSR